jgi:hypothetical protein
MDDGEARRFRAWRALRRLGRAAVRSRVSAGVESGCTHEGGPFGAVWSRGGAVEHVGGNVRNFVAKRLKESRA